LNCISDICKKIGLTNVTEVCRGIEDFHFSLIEVKVQYEREGKLMESTRAMGFADNEAALQIVAQCRNGDLRLAVRWGN
jgi:hypothetical protein